eukprot:SAG31_NODE_41174_length_277_cov_0.865169_1_plen_65_part_10
MESCNRRESLFKTKLPQVTPEELSKVKYGWTSTEYVKEPLALRISASGKTAKSSTGHYAELAGLD